MRHCLSVGGIRESQCSSRCFADSLSAPKLSSSLTQMAANVVEIGSGEDSPMVQQKIAEPCHLGCEELEAYLLLIVACYPEPVILSPA